MSQKVRWGILGTGAIATLFAESLSSAPGAELVSVASRKRSTAEAFAARFQTSFPSVRAAEGYEALARDPDVDLVYVATPNTEHKSHALMAIAGKKGVLCEKPFTLDANEARDVVAAARSARVFLMEAMWTRFAPTVRDLKTRLASGSIGDLRMGTFELGMPFRYDPAHRVFDPALGGGALLDLGIYTVSLAYHFFGPPTSIAAQAVLGTSGVDEQVTMLFGHANGRQTTCATSVRNRLANAATLEGTEGWARLQEPLYFPDKATIARVGVVGSAGRPPVVNGAIARIRQSPLARKMYRRARAVLPTRDKDERITHHRSGGHGYEHEVIEAMRCFREGLLESALMPLDETIQIMETLDQVRRTWTVLA